MMERRQSCADRWVKTAAVALLAVLALTGCCVNRSAQRAERMEEYLQTVQGEFIMMTAGWNYDLEVTAEHIGNETCTTLDAGYDQAERMYREGLLKASDYEMQRWYSKMAGAAARVLCPEHKETFFEIIDNNWSQYHR